MNWSEREIEVLEELYTNPNVTRDDMLKVLPDRTWKAIRIKANDIGLKRDSISGKIDEEYLKKLKEVVEF